MHLFKTFFIIQDNVSHEFVKADLTTTANIEDNFLLKFDYIEMAHARLTMFKDNHYSVVRVNACITYDLEEL